MAEEVLYADLNIPGANSSSRPPKQSQHFSSPPCPWWLRIAVGVGLAGIIILIIAVIALGFWGDRWHRVALSTLENNETRTISSTECSSHLEDFRSHLKQTLCEQHNSSLAEGSRCRLCPSNWQLHRDKCYWLSKEKKAWTQSCDDCSQRRSRMLVIQNQEEMNFIQNVIRGESYVWIGLRVTFTGDWTWVDKSLLDQVQDRPVCPMYKEGVAKLMELKSHTS